MFKLNKNIIKIAPYVRSEGVVKEKISNPKLF